MNESNKNFEFIRTCKLAGISFVSMSDFPEDKYESFRIALLVVNCILFFATISLNGISIITIRRSSQLRNKVCYFVILLQSVVDLIVGSLGIPLFIYYIISPFVKTADCIFIILAIRIILASCGLSMIALSAMTLERYMGVLHPYYYHSNVTKKRILIYAFGSSIMLALVLAYSFHDHRIFRFILTGSIIAFLLFTGFADLRIYLVIRKLIRSVRRPVCETDGNTNSTKRTIHESKRAKSCFLVAICFILCLVPSILTPLLFSVESFEKIVYLNWSLTAVILNCSINSVMFFWMKTLLRKEALNTLRSLKDKITFAE